MKTFAEKLFEYSELEMELFDRVNEILGCNSEQCTKEDFVWGALDVGFDEYDCSVEVIRPDGAEYMSREQANEVIGLGFSRIYESCGSKCRAWGKSDYFEAGPREADEILRLKAIIRELKRKD